jgi:hypothetical protein
LERIKNPVPPLKRGARGDQEGDLERIKNPVPPFKRAEGAI